jgi:hypothetical protein
VNLVKFLPGEGGICLFHSPLINKVCPPERERGINYMPLNWPMRDGMKQTKMTNPNPREGKGPTIIANPMSPSLMATQSANGDDKWPIN